MTACVDFTGTGVIFGDLPFPPNFRANFRNGDIDLDIVAAAFEDLDLNLE